MSARAAHVRFYVDADIRGLGLILGDLRNDVTYPADPGALIHKRLRPRAQLRPPTYSMRTGFRSWPPGDG